MCEAAFEDAKQIRHKKSTCEECIVLSQEVPNLPTLGPGECHRLRLVLPWAPAMPADPTGSMVDITLLATTNDGALRAVQAHAKARCRPVMGATRWQLIIIFVSRPLVVYCLFYGSLVGWFVFFLSRLYLFFQDCLLHPPQSLHLSVPDRSP